jgi:hypothetical protein
MQFINDSDCWSICQLEHLWIFDKLILSRKLGYSSAPAGIPVTKPGYYVVRPIMNLRMMSRGAKIRYLTPDSSLDVVPDGYFWQERFVGRHLSVDYKDGVQTLCVEGFRDNPDRLDRFSRWCKVDDIIPLPDIFLEIIRNYTWLNLEMVGGHVIEAHLRYNDDFSNHNCDTIIPVWSDQEVAQPADAKFYVSPSGDRIGFWIY